MAGAPLMDITGIGSIMDFGKALLERFVPDPAQKAKAMLDIATLQQNGDLARMASEAGLQTAQIDVNKAEAASTNWFVAGWRPFVGWTCGVALLYVALLEPLGRFTATVAFHYAGPYPVIDTSLTMQVLLGILGLGAMRSAEKIKGGEANR